MLREHANTVLIGILLVVILILLAGQIAGQPIGLGFVTSDSMEPALETGDGFVAVPHQLSGEIEEDDVIVFEAQELDGGGLTTHRVVDETKDGYITQGDGNAFTDQDGEEPPVTDDQIAATALQLNGEVVSIPGFGTAILSIREVTAGVQALIAGSLGASLLIGARSVGIVLLLVGLVLFITSFRSDRERNRSIDRETVVNGRHVAIILVLLVLLPVNAAMIAPSGTSHVTADGDRLEGEAEPGEQVHSEFTATNNGLITMLVALETTDEDASLDRDTLTLPANESTTATLATPAPPPGEREVVTVSEHRYVMILPESILLGLHDINPVLAWGVINLILTVSMLGLVGGTIGLRPRRVRNTCRSLPFRVRIRRRLR